MNLIADILLAAGALGAAVYCIVLARRLNRFNNLQDGMGGAVAVLSAQVDDMTKTLRKAQKAAATSSAELTGLTGRAEEAAKRLELMLAALHDLPETSPDAGLEGNRAPYSAPDPTPDNVPADPPQGKADLPQPDAPVFLSKRALVLEAAE